MCSQPDSEQEEQQVQASAAEGDCPNLGGTWSTRYGHPLAIVSLLNLHKQNVKIIQLILNVMN